MPVTVRQAPPHGEEVDAPPSNEIGQPLPVQHNVTRAGMVRPITNPARSHLTRLTTDPTRTHLTRLTTNPTRTHLTRLTTNSTRTHLTRLNTDPSQARPVPLITNLRPVRLITSRTRATAARCDSARLITHKVPARRRHGVRHRIGQPAEQRDVVRPLERRRHVHKA
ncbi:MAG TPA: hypothetical protein VFW65_27515 [Pseudonocardiaceae bacterium]|nr:hypothetical protein [Pseudonocardiaceae bacterium]